MELTLDTVLDLDRHHIQFAAGETECLLRQRRARYEPQPRASLPKPSRVLIGEQAEEEHVTSQAPEVLVWKAQARVSHPLEKLGVALQLQGLLAQPQDLRGAPKPDQVGLDQSGGSLAGNVVVTVGTRLPYQRPDAGSVEQLQVWTGSDVVALAVHQRTPAQRCGEEDRLCRLPGAPVGPPVAE